MFMDVCFISTPFFDICLYLSAALVLVVFDNLSIRKPVSYKSKDVKFSTCSTCFVDFVSGSFYIKFRNFFLSHGKLNFAPFLRKSHSENRPRLKSIPYPVSGGAQRRRPACALLNISNCSSSNCCSNSKQYLFESIAIVTDSKNRKMEKSISKEFITGDLDTLLGRSPVN